MLVITRKRGQQVRIDGPATVTVVDVDRGRVRLGIAAGAEVRVLRGELADRGPGERLPSVARRLPANGKISR